MTKTANMVVKVALTGEAMVVAQEKAMAAEKELKIAQERVAMAEAKAGRPSNSTYTKLFQTSLIIIGGYLVIFVLLHIINHQIKDLNATNRSLRRPPPQTG